MYFEYSLGYGQCWPVDPLFPEGEGAGSEGLHRFSGEYAAARVEAGCRKAQAGIVPCDEYQDEQNNWCTEQDGFGGSAPYTCGFSGSQ